MAPTAAWGRQVRCALVLTRKHENKVAALQDLVASLAGSSVQLLGAVVNEF